MIRVLLLGAPLILVDGEPLHLQRRLLRSLLFYLACQTEAIGRSELATLLWDRPEDEAMRLLRETLSKLRAQLPDRDAVQVERDWIRIDPEHIQSDVLEFQQLYEQTARLAAQTPSAIPLPDNVSEKMNHAVGLWRSPVFLAGARLPESEMLDAWLTTFSHELEVRRQRLLERLVEHDLACGNPESAIQRLHETLVGDEYNEGLQFRLINLLRRQQRYTEAMNHCSYLLHLFQGEGYNELPPGLASLYRQVREEALQVQSGEPSIWPGLSSAQAPFIGRKEILRDLQMAFHRGGTVILFGEGGAGKTRLAQELYFSLKPAPRLLFTSAHPLESGLQLQPVVEMLRRSISAEEWGAMEPNWLVPLLPLMPELAIMHPNLERSPFQDGDRLPQLQLNLLFESLLRLLQKLSRRQHLLMVIDDAQWCDEQTLLALSYWTNRRLFSENGALVLAARREEIGPELEAFLSQPHRTVQQISLPLLDRDESNALLRSVMGSSFPKLAQRLHRETGGNPFFLLESLRALANQSLDPQTADDLEYLPLASNVQSLIRARLQQLPPDAQQVINAAAVCGQDFSIEMLSTVTLLPSEQVLQALEWLERYNLLKAVSHDMPSGGYDFIHEQVREVVLLSLSPTRRRLLHLRVAHTLENIYGGQNKALSRLLAAHYEAAGNLKQAFRYWMEDAWYDYLAHAGTGAQIALEHAENLLERMEPLTLDQDYYDLYRQWGQIAFDLANADAMQRSYTRMLEIGRQQHNPLLVGSAYNGMAQRAMLLLDPDSGMGYLEKAIPQLERVDAQHELAEAYNRAGIFHMYQDRYPKAIESFQKALPYSLQAATTREIEARLTTYHQMALAECLSGNPRRAIDLAQLALKDAERILDHANITRALLTLALTHMFAGRYHASMGYLDSARPMVETMQNRRALAQFQMTYSQVAFSLGLLDESRTAAQTALELATAFNDNFIIGDAYVRLGDLDLYAGQMEQAARCYQTGCDIVPNGYRHFDNRWHLGLALAGMGRVSEGLDHIQAAQTFFQQSGMSWLERLAYLAEIHIRLSAPGPLAPDEHAEIAARIETAIQDWQALGLDFIAARGLALRALNALKRSQPELARADAQAALDLAKKMGHFPLIHDFERGFGNVLATASL